MGNEIQKPLPLPPWEQRDGEPDWQYSVFHIYMTLGPMRTIARLARKVSRPGDTDNKPVHRNLLTAMSHEFDWEKRCVEFDRWTREQSMAIYKDRLFMHCKDEAELSNHLFIFAKKLLRRLTHADYQSENPMKDLLDAAECASKIGRRALGVPLDVKIVDERSQAPLPQDTQMDWYREAQLLIGQVVPKPMPVQPAPQQSSSGVSN